RDCAQPAGSQLAERDAGLGGALDPVTVWIGYGDEVRLHLGRVDPDPFGEPARARVIVGEALDVVVERVQRGRCEDPRLPERAAEQVLALPRTLDERRRAGEDRAGRAAEALREADSDGVREMRPVGRCAPGSDGRVEETGAVEVHGGATLPRSGGGRLEVLQGPYAPAGAAVRVLEDDDPARPEIRVLHG